MKLIEWMYKNRDHLDPDFSVIYNNGGVIIESAFLDDGCLDRTNLGEHDDVDKCSLVTRSEFERYKAVQDWYKNPVGAPPVGAVVDLYCFDKLTAQDLRVMCRSHNYVTIDMRNGRTSCRRIASDGMTYRPHPSEKDKFTEQLLSEVSGITADKCRQLYDLGYRKK